MGNMGNFHYSIRKHLTKEQFDTVKRLNVLKCHQMALETFGQIWQEIGQFQDWAKMGNMGNIHYSIRKPLTKKHFDTVKRLNVLKCHQMALQTFEQLWANMARNWAILALGNFVKYWAIFTTQSEKLC